jgi:hypothetical protein
MARKQRVSNAGVHENLIQQQNYKDTHRNKPENYFLGLLVITGVLLIPRSLPLKVLVMS